MDTPLFVAFAYGSCFVAGFIVVWGLSYLAPRDMEAGDNQEEVAETEGEIIRSWKPIGFAGGLIGMLYYGLAPHDPGLNTILMTIWRTLGALWA